MSLERLNCNHCGASLDVARSANFVTCRECGSRLAVRRTATSSFTEVLPPSDERFSAEPLPASGRGEPEWVQPSALIDDRRDAELAALRIENALNRLDIEWDREKKRYEVRGQYGHRWRPTMAGSVFMGIVTTVGGIAWTAIAVGITTGFGNARPGFGPPPVVQILFPAFGVVFILFGLGFSIHCFAKAAAYREARERYHDERARLMSELEEIDPRRRR